MKALADLASYLAENETYHPTSKQFFLEGEMLTDGSDTSKPDLGSSDNVEIKAIRQFAWQMKTMGLSTTVVWRQGKSYDPNQAVALTLPFPEVL